MGEGVEHVRIMHAPGCEFLSPDGTGCTCGAFDHLKRTAQRNGHEVTAAHRVRLNVARLSTGFGDHQYMWRSSLDCSLIQFGRYGSFWVNHVGENRWQRVSDNMITPRPGERFIRVGQVIP
jgi:hypothetical protein